MSKEKINYVVVVSDIHSGCQLSLVPPGGARLDEGGTYKPSSVQRKMWQMWQEFWHEFVPSVVRKHKFAVVFNGDAIDGIHHGSTTQWSHNLEDQVDCAYAILKPVVDQCEGLYYHIRGTEAHVGQSAYHEERLAKRLGSIPSREGQYARWDLWKLIGPKRAHFLHHIGTTGSQAYEATAVHKELTEEFLESARWGRKPPDIVVRSHRHRYIKTEMPVQSPGEKHETGTAISIVTPCWQGKMLDLNTPLSTPRGWTTMGEVGVGDTLFDERGEQCRVTAVLPVDLRPESYVVTFSNGESVKACADHLWLTTASVDRPGVPGGPTKRPLTRVRTTREIRDTLRAGRPGSSNHIIAMPSGLLMPNADLPVDPYVLGCWLGDGDSDSAIITCHDSDFEHFNKEFEKAGYGLSRKNGQGDRCPRYRLRAVDPDDGQPVGKASPLNLQKRLRLLGVLGNKHIPATYLRASFDQRLALLQGLMDTDGYAENRGRVCEISTSSVALREGICELLATMGIKFSCVHKTAGGYESWRIRFFMSPDVLPVFRMSRKLNRIPLASDRKVSRQRSRSVSIVSVEPCDSVPMRCIAVDSPSHLYLFGRTMLPTHNTPYVYKIAGGRLSEPQFGGFVICYHDDDGVLYTRERVWTLDRSAEE